MKQYRMVQLSGGQFMPITLELARQLLLEKTISCDTISLPLEQCWNMVLGADIEADTDFPPFDRSPLDGYAVRSEDVKSAFAATPVVLQMVDYIPAGMTAGTAVVPGTAARIMTGAPIPPGADGIVRLEDTLSNGTDITIFTGKGAAGNICRQGEEIKQGEIMLRAGTVLNAGSISLLAMLGIANPRVFRRPRVAILATGSEVIDIDQPLSPAKIRNSNNYMLMVQIKEAGGDPVLLGRVDDNVDEIVARLQGVPKCDLYITTGGASVGDYDLAEQVFSRLEAIPFFSRVAIKPGMPVWAGRWDSSWLIALSGNPAAASISFEVLIRPLLCKMAGLKNIERMRTKGTLIGEISKASPTRRFVWATYSLADGRLLVRPLLQGNGMLRSLCEANALIDIAANSPALAVGAEVDILLLSTN